MSDNPTNPPAPETPAVTENANDPAPAQAPPVLDAGNPNEPAPGPPDVGQQIEALRKEIAAGRQEQAPPPVNQQRRNDVADINDLLSYDPYANQGDPNAQQGQQQYQQPQQQQQPQAQSGPMAPEQAEAMFNQAIQDRVQDAVYPYLEAVDREMRRGQLERMAEELPELKEAEAVRAVRDRLMPIAERYDDPSLLSDPELVRQAVMAERQMRSAQSETPATEARDKGAVLETGHAAAASTEDDPVAAFKRDLLQQGAPQDVFTSGGFG